MLRLHRRRPVHQESVAALMHGWLVVLTLVDLLLVADALA
jgi:hypothetical protein